PSVFERGGASVSLSFSISTPGISSKSTSSSEKTSVASSCSSASEDPSSMDSSSASVSIIAIVCPTCITSPSSHSLSLSTPFTGEGISESTLSVATSIIDSSSSISSPTDLSHPVIVASATLSPIRGNTTLYIAISKRLFSYFILKYENLTTLNVNKTENILLFHFVFSVTQGVYLKYVGH